MSAPGTVVVLNGTSSAGKTSLARALQDRWDGPVRDAGIDRHLTMLPRRYLSSAWPDVFRYDTAPDGTITRVVPGPVAHDLVRAMHRSAAALAGAGFDVVVDHVLLDPAWARDLAEAMHGTRAVLVGVRCEPPVLLERERERGERTLGQALAQLPYVHSHGPYDVEVDTAVLDVDGAADAVLAWFRAGVEPSALASGVEKQPAPDPT